MYGPLFITTVHGDAAWAKKVQKAYENSNTPDLRARFSHFVISFRDQALLRAGLDYALTNVVDSREFMTLLLAGVLKETAAVRFEWLKENFELVSKRLEPKTLEVVAIDMISAGDPKLFADGELFLLDPKRRTPVYERVLEARKKELAPHFARRERNREDLARALDKGLKGNLHETSPPEALRPSGVLNPAHQAIRYHPQPVDVTRVPEELAGFRTLFSAFHHFRPEQARAILGDAVRKHHGIAVFEGTYHSALSPI